MFERLTIPARQVLIAATEVAAAVGSRQVEGVHLLVGFAELSSVVQPTVAEHLPDGDRLRAEARRLSLPGSGAQPSFGEEVNLAVAAGIGISVGRDVPAVGTATLLLGLLTVASRNVTELLRNHRADIDAFRDAVAALDDSAELSVASADGATWIVTIGGSQSAVAWDDERE